MSLISYSDAGRKFWSMKLFYFHVAEDVPLGIRPHTSVVIDVLRATTTIACALNNGAEAVKFFSDISKLKEDSRHWPDSSSLLLGERGGKTLSGFHLGNSPVLVTPEKVKDKRIFMSTTNGTKSFSRLQESQNLYAMSLINREAVADHILKDDPDELIILGSGWEGSYSMEDSLAAGSLASFLIANKNKCLIANDEVYAALALWNQWQNNLEGCLRITSHGKRLQRLGDHDLDFKRCAELDRIKIVPTQSEPGILRSN